MSSRAAFINRLYVAELPSPRLFLGPSSFTKSMFGNQPTSTAPKKPTKQRRLRGDAYVEQNYPHLYVKR